MGKFSKPRKKHALPDETVVLPKPIDPPVPASPEEAAQASGEIMPPVSQPDPIAELTKSPVSRGRKIMLISLCSVAAALLLAAIGAVWFFFLQDPNDHRILNNVYVAGINLGGMTREEASAALHKATDNTYTANDMVIELPDTIMALSPGNTKVSLDVDAAVEAAYEYGRTGSWSEKKAILESSLTTDHPIGLLPYLNLDMAYVRAQLDAYGASFNSTYLASSAVLEGNPPVLNAADPNFTVDAPGQTMVLTLGTPGRYVNIEDVYNRVLDAYSFNRFLVQVSMEEEEKLPTPLNLQELYDAHYIEPTDATFDTETYDVIPEIYGYGFDLEDAMARLENASYGDVLEIPMVFVEPAMLGETLESMLFRDILCEYKTEHTKNEKRNTNLRLACEAINGTILYPGDTFDFNTVVGKRTVEKGYKTAAAYSSGKTVETLGGGICQVSSTIYYCCLIADLEIVNRLPHSYVSSYMPMGMDATVSWGGPEFTFKNSTNFPIRIETWVADGYVHCKLIGTDEKDYYIEMEYDIIGYQPWDTVYEEYPEENNPEGYKDGETIQTAYNGYTVKTYKLTYSKDVTDSEGNPLLLSREFDRTSSYKKRDKIVAKIIPKATEPPATDAPQSPPPEDATPEA